jgi:hypothetical protein
VALGGGSAGDLERLWAQVSKGKRRGAQGERDGAFTSDRGGRRDGRRRHPWRLARAPLGGGAPVPPKRCGAVEAARLDVAKLLAGAVSPIEASMCRIERWQASLPARLPAGAAARLQGGSGGGAQQCRAARAGARGLGLLWARWAAEGSTPAGEAAPWPAAWRPGPDGPRAGRRLGRRDPGSGLRARPN